MRLNRAIIKNLKPLLLIPVAMVGIAATTYTITQLQSNTSPSDGSVIEIYDPSASPKSGKYVLTNLVKRAGDNMGPLSVTSFTNSAATASRLAVTGSDKALGSVSTTGLVDGTGSAADASDVTGALGYTPLSTNSSAGLLSRTVVAEGAYFLTGLNCISIAKNSLATIGTTQYVGFVTTNLNIGIAVRNLPNGAITKTVLTNAVSDADEHRVVSISTDAAGKVHVAYGNHNDALNYIRTTNSADLASFSGRLSMLGTHETLVTYPMFISHPTTRELYFTFRFTTGVNADQYFYHYNTNSSSWEAAAGTGTQGIMIDGTSSGVRAYLNGLPKFDSTGKLWWNWSWYGSGTGGTNQMVIYWDGSAFKKSDGTSQTIPATLANCASVYTYSPDPSGGLQVQNDFCVDSNGKVFIPYTRLDATTTNYQSYVLENSTGTWTERQIDVNLNTPANLPTPYPYPYYTAFSIGRFVYVVIPSVFDADRGILAYQSEDGFVTWRKFYISMAHNPNWSMCPDPVRLSQGIASFAFIHANDSEYQQIYVNTNLANASISNVNLGKLSVLDWIPSPEVGTPNGMPRDLYGLNMIGTYAIEATNIITSAINSFNVNSGSNFERMLLGWNGNRFQMQTTKGGTGTLRDIGIVAGGELLLGGGQGFEWKVNSSGHLTGVSANSYDIQDARFVRVNRTMVSGVTSPSQITADQNNYNPGAQGKYLRLSTDASRNITGLTFTTSQVTGEDHIVINVGSNPVVLVHESASSTAANRFHNTTGADITLSADQEAYCWYDGTTARWRISKRN